MSDDAPFAANKRPPRKAKDLVQIKIRLRERDRREAARRARVSGRSLRGELSRALEVGMQAEGLERTIETTTLRTILAVVQELGANPERGALLAWTVGRKLKPEEGSATISVVG
jgi:hypothetical protein